MGEELMEYSMYRRDAQNPQYYNGALPVRWIVQRAKSPCSCCGRGYQKETVAEFMTEADAAHYLNMLRKD